MKTKTSLTARQLYVMPFLLSSPSVESASKQSGVSVKTIFEWFKEPLFKQELEKRRMEGVENAVNKLKAASCKATDTLIMLLDEADSYSVKHRVAVDMLNLTLKFMEYQDIDQRLKKLEEAHVDIN